MTFPQYNAAFTRQFREENVGYPMTEPFTYNKLLISQYAGLVNEIEVLGPWLSEKMHNTELIRCIVDKLENKDIVHSFHLLEYTRELQQVFHASIDTEPYTARYYDGLITSLESFCDLISTFSVDMDVHLSSNLKQLNESKPEGDGNWEIDSSFTDKVLEVIAFYTNHIQTYCTYFNEALEHESSNGNSIQVSSQVAGHLEKLIALTEKMTNDLDFTREMLLVWEMEMECLSEEELYN